MKALSSNPDQHIVCAALPEVGGQRCAKVFLPLYGGIAELPVSTIVTMAQDQSSIGGSSAKQEVTVRYTLAIR